MEDSDGVEPLVSVGNPAGRVVMAGGGMALNMGRRCIWAPSGMLVSRIAAIDSMAGRFWFHRGDMGASSWRERGSPQLRRSSARIIGQVTCWEAGSAGVCPAFLGRRTIELVRAHGRIEECSGRDR